ncbi:tRNA lysidine(34) synthetase TilS [Methylobacterium sp. NEAU 140]|uniref:tRNA lysidine(34) synthetase TilS n=1 Tax=Methylobacterium sp. NEAU 140 TaxID=3064945 RepID=UPI002736A673|nr:tRNA lysidine(34) synthetase TilS [Methylobacterium sp. NEAU 140]MDP4021647.1 tRNA lysidine(34) synthetase TilS [Methylobacterium sp. NEAU 140]
MHAAAALGASAHVATVDHRLRPDSAAEAASVARAAAALGLPHATLAWTATKPATGLQEAARAARYRLLAAHAAAVGADRVLTAHTRDDQAETVLLRLCAGSGPAGLAGMRAERPLAPGIGLGRPFLALPKAALVAWCEARAIPFVRDPSNAQPRFARARLRAARSALEAEGLTAARLARLAERAARDEAALTEAAGRALEAARLGPDAPLRLDGGMLAALPEAVALRCLDRAMTRAGAAPRRLERLEALVLGALLPALRRGEAVRRTLAGLVVAADARGTLTLAPAPPRRSAPGALPMGRDVGRDGVPAAPDLLGKGEPHAYIGGACSEEPALLHEKDARGTARARD